MAGSIARQNIRDVGRQTGADHPYYSAAGGVGSYASEIARNLGARVIGTASWAVHDKTRRRVMDAATNLQNILAAKAKYDPNRVLSPHPAIFDERSSITERESK